MRLDLRAVTHPVTSAARRWFAKRAPRRDSATLNLRNVYIFFSREGVLFAVLLVITFIAGINYGNNLVLGLCFYLVSVWLISIHVTFSHISGLQVHLIDVTMAEAGQPVWVTVQLRSHSRQPRRQLLLEFDPVSEATLQHSQQQRIASLDHEHRVRLPVYTDRRGQLELPRLSIKTTYPLGIMRAWSYVYFARQAWVYPKPQAFDLQALHTAKRHNDDDVGGQHVPGQDDFERLDTYITGESLARVSWGHVARGQGMLTKHFADPIGSERRLDYEEMPAAQHEHKLAQLAYGVIRLGELGVPFQLHLPNSQPANTDPDLIGSGHAFTQASLLRLANAP